MRKWIGMLLVAIAVVSLILTISCKPAVNDVSSYAEDRAHDPLAADTATAPAASAAAHEGANA